MKIDINLNLETTAAEIRKALVKSGQEIHNYLQKKLENFCEECSFEDHTQGPYYQAMNLEEYLPFACIFSQTKSSVRVQIRFIFSFDWKKNKSNSFSILITCALWGAERSYELPLKKIYNQKFINSVKQLLELKVDLKEFEELIKWILKAGFPVFFLKVDFIFYHVAKRIQNFIIKLIKKVDTSLAKLGPLTATSVYPSTTKLNRGRRYKILNLND